MLNKGFFFGLLCAGIFAGAAVPKPSWVGNGLGVEGLSPDYVEPGFGLKPLQLQGRTIVMDFKRVTLGDNGLPKAIAVNDEPVLSAPVSLEASLAGTAQVFRPLAASLSKSGRNQIVGEFVTGNEELELKTTLRVDFDFAFCYSVTVSPKHPVKLDKLLFSIPMVLPDDKLMAVNLEPLTRPLSGMEKERRRPRFVFKDDQLFEYEYPSVLWLGNTKYGVSVNFSSGANWHSTHGKEMAFDPRSSRLTYRFIDHEYTLEKPETYQFYFIVTPLRKMPRNWRDWRVRTRYTNYTETDGNQLIYWQNWRVGATEIHNNLWVAGPDNLRGLVAKDAANGCNRLAYKAPGLITHTVLYEKDGKHFVLEDPYLRELCLQSPAVPPYFSRKVTIPDDAEHFTDAELLAKAMGFDNSFKLHSAKARGNSMAVLYTPELMDYEVAAVNNILEHGANGVYYDGIGAPIFFDQKDDRGEVRGHFNMELTRDFYKRSRALMRGRDPQCMMLAHNTGCRYTPGISFFDMQLFGENHFYWYQEPDKRDLSKNGDYYYAHIIGDIDNLKVDFARQWGLPQVLLPELRGRDYKTFPDMRKGTRTMLAYVIQFDLLLWTSWCDADQIYRYDAIRKDWDMKDNDFSIVDFTPYWENKTFACPDSDVKVGYYERKVQRDPDVPLDPTRKYLVLVSNIQFSDVKTTLKVPALADLKVIDRWNDNRPLAVKDNQVEIELDPYGFAVLEIIGKDNMLQ